MRTTPGICVGSWRLVSLPCWVVFSSCCAMIMGTENKLSIRGERGGGKHLSGFRLYLLVQLNFLFWGEGLFFNKALYLLQHAWVKHEGCRRGGKSVIVLRMLNALKDSDSMSGNCENMSFSETLGDWIWLKVTATPQKCAMKPHLKPISSQEDSGSQLCEAFKDKMF